LSGGKVLSRAAIVFFANHPGWLGILFIPFNEPPCLSIRTLRLSLKVANATDKILLKEYISNGASGRCSILLLLRFNALFYIHTFDDYLPNLGTSSRFRQLCLYLASDYLNGVTGLTCIL